jgi:hypothetical protein
MELLKKYQMKQWMIIGIACALAGIGELQAQPMDRMLRFKAGDSAWIYPRFFGSDRYFIGEEMLRRRQWIQHLHDGDAEVADLIMRGHKFRRTGNIVAIAGFSSLIIGAMTMNAFDPVVSTTGAVLFIGGLTTEISTSILYGVAGRNYVQGWRLFNYKARRGELAPITLHMGPGDYGIGLQVRW